MTLFTKKEKQVIIILIGVLIGGYGIKLYNQSNIYEGFNSISQKEKEKFKQIAENAFIDPSKQSQNSKSSVNKSTSEKDYKPTEEIININTAQKKVLIKLPNVGKVTAERIIKYRDDFGPFKTGTDLLKIKGIGKKTLNKILPKIIF
jgi:competence ComEA-like helix-hairpin-helix protein